MRCLSSRTHETGSKSSWSSGLLSLWVLSLAYVGRSCVRCSVVLVLGAVVCLVFLPGLVVWACPLLSSPGPVSSFDFEKRLQPREPSQRLVFRQVTLSQPGQLRFTWPWDLWILRFLIIFLFSVCSGGYHFIQFFPRPSYRYEQRWFPWRLGSLS